MKHLEYEVWAEIRKTKEQELATHEALVKMEEDYKSAKKKLNKKFVKTYEEEDRFHDMGLVGYKMYPRKKMKDYVLNIEIELHYHNNFRPSYLLKFNQVQDFAYNHTSQVMERWARIPLVESFGTWMYSEIYLEDKYIVMNIALAGSGEINIKCKDIKVEEL